jgi:pyrroloquinoline quinone biosynthesis protein B
VGLQVTDEATGRTLFYAPGFARMEPHLHVIFDRASCVLVDGTFWSDDELMRQNISDKRAQDMGHLPQSGQGGMIEVLAGYPRARKVLVHINNTNPILDEDSLERSRLAEAGIEVAHDGMEFVV